MKVGAPRFFRRSLSLGMSCVLLALLAACTAHGGGYLPPGATAGDAFPNTVFTGRASFGVNFSCEDRGGVNPPTGRLHLQLSYTDHGTSPLLGAPFSIHGTADRLDPVVESAFCIGQNPPPGGNELIFLGRYRATGSPPSGFPATCAKRETKATPQCRFEVIVRDNDGDLDPSKGDFLSIKLSSDTAVASELDPATVFYARAGYLQGGNLTVK